MCLSFFLKILMDLPKTESPERATPRKIEMEMSFEVKFLMRFRDEFLFAGDVV
jgi:hypothetical protein